MTLEAHIDTNPGPHQQLIDDYELEEFEKSRRRAKGIFIFWGSDWPEESLRAYLRRYDLTNTELYPPAFFLGTNTDCKSIIAQSFQNPILEKVKGLLDEFEIVDYETTLEYLTKYRNLTSLLKQAQRGIRRYFNDAKTSLVPKIDPETGKEEIWLYVHTDLPVSKALDILDRFDEFIFTNIWQKSDHRLCCDLIFI